MKKGRKNKAASQDEILDRLKVLDASEDEAVTKPERSSVDDLAHRLVGLSKDTGVHERDAAEYRKLSYADALAEQDSYDRNVMWQVLEDDLESIAALSDEELAPSLWTDIITRLAVLAVQDAALNAAVARGATSQGLQIVAELKAARRRQRRPFSQIMMQRPSMQRSMRAIGPKD